MGEVASSSLAQTTIRLSTAPQTGGRLFPHEAGAIFRRLSIGGKAAALNIFTALGFKNAGIVDSHTVYLSNRHSASVRKEGRKLAKHMKLKPDDVTKTVRSGRK